MKPSSRVFRTICTALLGIALLSSVSPRPTLSQMARFADSPDPFEVCLSGQTSRGSAGGFQIDGNLIFNPLDIPPDPYDPGITPLRDWFGGFPDPSFGLIDPLSCTLMQRGIYFRDDNWATAFDRSIFRTTSNKNNDDISMDQGWNWQGGNGYPQKDDLTEIYGRLVLADNPMTGEQETWLVLGTSTRATDGSKHIDFEWNSAGFVQTGGTEGKIFGSGPDKGRTAQADFILSIDYERGGADPVDTLRIWNGNEFCLVDDAGCVPAPPGGSANLFKAAVNCSTISSPCLVTDPDGHLVNQYTPLQFVETAVNLSQLGIVIGDDLKNVPHIIVKTRSSASFTAELKDFALVKFQNPPPPVCRIQRQGSGSLACGDTASFCGIVDPVGGTVTYAWSVTGGMLLSPASDPCVKVKAGSGSSFSLSLLVTRNGIPALAPCDTLIPIVPATCFVNPFDPNRVVAQGDTATFCAGVNPPIQPGGTLAFNWNVSGGTPITPTTASCVTIRVDNTVRVILCPNITRNGCAVPACCDTIPLCMVKAVTMHDTLACGDTASFCAVLGVVTNHTVYQWTATGATIVGSSTASAVTVRANGGTSFTVCVTAGRRNEPQTTCCRTEPLRSRCLVTAAPGTPATLQTGQTGTYCVSVTPPIQPGGTLSVSWAVCGGTGTIEGPSNGTCVTVRAGTGTFFDICPTVSRNAGAGCPAFNNCNLRVPIITPPVCNIVQVPPRPLFCGDTASFCAEIKTPVPTGARVTYTWTITGNGQIVTAASAACVQVRAGSGGDFTLHLVVAVEGVSGDACALTVPIAEPKCDIVAIDPLRALACGDTLTFCASINPPGGTVIYNWNIVGGVILTSPGAPCVQVKAGSGASFTLTLTAKRNNCPINCSLMIPIVPPKCDIVAIDASRVMSCGDTLTFCSSVFPSGGTRIYEWNITGGFIISAPSAQCVTVRAGSGGSFTLSLNLKRNNCMISCSRMVPIVPPKCDIVAIDPNRVLACGDTLTFCASINPAGGTRSFQWTITGGTIVTSPNASCVQVKAGTTSGQFTLTLNALRNNCPIVCERTVPIGLLKCDVIALNPSRVLACGDTATFCAQITPSGGTVIYQWTIVGGQILTSPSAPCVQVQVGNGTEFTIKVDIKRNNCTTSCERTVPLTTPSCQIIKGQSTLCAGDTSSYCAAVTPPGPVVYAWTISGNGSFVTPPTASSACVTVRAGVGSGTSFTLNLTVTRGNCSSTCTRTVTVTPVAPCASCVVGYPDQSHNPQSKGTLDIDQVVKTFDPKNLTACVTGDTLLRVFYSSDRVMLLGYRRVEVKTSSGITAMDFPVPPAPTVPSLIRNPVVGDTLPTGDFRFGDWYERPVFPALWITDITNDPTSRMGDWAYKVARALPDTGAIPPHKVCGLWKWAVRYYDKTVSSPRAVTLSDFPDPTHNVWNLGPESDVPTEGFAAVPNGGYGAEAAWNLTRLGLQPGHSYRLFFSMYEGGENPHPNLGCLNLRIPPVCPPATPLSMTQLEDPNTKPTASRGVELESGPEVTGVSTVQPKRYVLFQNLPNPFGKETAIRYSVPVRSHVTVKVFSVSGREVATLENRMVEPGEHSVTWTTSARAGVLQPGVYLYQLVAESPSAGPFRMMKKMVLLK